RHRLSVHGDLIVGPDGPCTRRPEVGAGARHRPAPPGSGREPQGRRPPPVSSDPWIISPQVADQIILPPSSRCCPNTPMHGRETTAATRGARGGLWFDQPV